MKRYYANLLGNWVDITDTGTVEDDQKPSTYFKEHLSYDADSRGTAFSDYDYINIGYGGKNYRIHTSMIQIVTE